MIATCNARVAKATFAARVWRPGASFNVIVINAMCCPLVMQAGKAFDDYWVPIGDGLLAVRRTVMAALRLSKARGGYYNEAFGKLCAKTPYAEMHKVERSNLLYCMEHLPDLEMRVGWTPTERAKINHPTSMAQRLREFLNRAPTEAPRRNASPMALLKDKNEQLQRANLDLSERLASAEARGAGGSRCTCAAVP